MAFQVVNADGRPADGMGQPLAQACAHQERSGKARPLGVGDGIQVPPREACLLDHLL